MHMSRPPATELFSGRPFPGCWVAVNEGGAAPGINRYAAPCDGDSGFSISNVPAGDYELKVFDADARRRHRHPGLHRRCQTATATAPCRAATSARCRCSNWFNRLTTYIFNDDNQNGFWDGNESQRWAQRAARSTCAGATAPSTRASRTDFEGAAPFDESFPWFHWMVAEVGFTNKKATGATVVVDAGGEVDTSTDAFPGFGELTPQLQSENGGLEPGAPRPVRS